MPEASAISKRYPFSNPYHNHKQVISDREINNAYDLGPGRRVTFTKKS